MPIAYSTSSLTHFKPHYPKEAYAPATLLYVSEFHLILQKFVTYFVSFAIRIKLLELIIIIILNKYI